MVQECSMSRSPLEGLLSFAHLLQRASRPSFLAYDSFPEGISRSDAMAIQGVVVLLHLCDAMFFDYDPMCGVDPLDMTTPEYQQGAYQCGLKRTLAYNELAALAAANGLPPPPI